MNRSAALAVTLSLCASALAYGQTKSVSPRDVALNEMVDTGLTAIKKNVPGGTPFATSFGNGRNELVIEYLIAAHIDRAGYQTLLDAQLARVDKQVGATPSATGSTSLSTKGLVPDILGVAVESGALTEDVKGSVVTFRATPTGIVKALQGQGILEINRDYSNDVALRFASRFSAAASFDASLGSSTTTFTGGTQQLTNWSVRYVVINQRDPASPQYRQLWRGLLKDDKPGQTASADYDQAVRDINTALAGWGAFQDWERDLGAKVDKTVDGPWRTDHNNDAAAARFRTLLQSQLPALEKLPGTPKAVFDALDRYVAASLRVQGSFDNIYDLANKGLLATFDWSTARDSTLPDLYTATGVIEAGLGASRKTDLTVNVTASVYKRAPANASQAFKSFDLTAQLEHPLGASFVLPSATGALSARYSYLPKDTVVASGGTSGPAASGSIFYVQGKVTVPIKGSGVKVPLSVTASNRTELIKEANVRGSVGLTFDLDTFLTVLGVNK